MAYVAATLLVSTMFWPAIISNIIKRRMYSKGIRK